MDLARVATPPWFHDQCERLEANEKGLDHLNLNIRRLSLPMASQLANALVSNNVLTVLNLTSSFGAPGCIDAIAKALSSRSSLEVIYLAYNGLVDVGALGYAMRTNTSLRELHLDHNRIDAAAGVALAGGLESNSTLRVLNLASNKIGDKGAVAIAKALGTSGTKSGIRRVELDRNLVGNKGGRALLSALQNNYTLQHISLRENDMKGYLSQMVTFLSHMNGNGRNILPFNTEVPDGVWSHLLSRQTDHSAVFFFLQAKPSLCQSAGRREEMDMA